MPQQKPVYLEGAVKQELRRWEVSVQVEGARNGELLVGGSRLWQEWLDSDFREEIDGYTLPKKQL